jgi:hypothetical protein
MLDELDPTLKVDDQNEVARARRDCDRNLWELLFEFETVRRTSIAFLMRPEQRNSSAEASLLGLGGSKVEKTLHYVR